MSNKSRRKKQRCGTQKMQLDQYVAKWMVAVNKFYASQKLSHRSVTLVNQIKPNKETTSS